MLKCGFTKVNSFLQFEKHRKAAQSSLVKEADNSGRNMVIALDLAKNRNNPKGDAQGGARTKVKTGPRIESKTIIKDGLKARLKDGLKRELLQSRGQVAQARTSIGIQAAKGE